MLKAARRAANETRNCKPSFIEACTYRLKEHWGVGEDWDLGYRSREEGEQWTQKCPFKQLRKIMKLYGISESEIEDLEDLALKKVAEAAKFAIESPTPLGG